MELTDERKKYIDGLSYSSLLSRVRFAPSGDPWFQDSTGEYWMKRLAEVRDSICNEERVKASKSLGWV